MLLLRGGASNISLHSLLSGLILFSVLKRETKDETPPTYPYKACWVAWFSFLSWRGRQKMRRLQHIPTQLVEWLDSLFRLEEGGKRWDASNISLHSLLSGLILFSVLKRETTYPYTACWVAWFSSPSWRGRQKMRRLQHIPTQLVERLDSLLRLEEGGKRLWMCPHELNNESPFAQGRLLQGWHKSRCRDLQIWKRQRAGGSVAGDCLLQDLSREEEGPGGILRCSDTIDLLKKAELRWLERHFGVFDRILVLVPLFMSHVDYIK